MGAPVSVIGLLSDFNTLNLAACLEKVAGSTRLTCVQGPYGEPRIVLLDTAAEFWSGGLEAVVVWTLPQRAVPTFEKALRHQEFQVDALLAEVDAFAAMLVRI